jgi:hypothetical protein
MNSDKYLEPSLFERDSILFKSRSDQEPNLGPFMETSQKRPCNEEAKAGAGR